MSGMAMDMNSGGEPGLELRVSEPFRKQGHRSLFQVREGGSQPAGGCSDYSNEAESFICGQSLSGGVLWGQRVLAQSLTWRRLMTVRNKFPRDASCWRACGSFSFHLHNEHLFWAANLGEGGEQAKRSPEALPRVHSCI